MHPSPTTASSTTIETFGGSHSHTPNDDSIPNHFHPHRPTQHKQLRTPPANDAKRVDDNTVKYNYLNAMEYPSLYGVQQTTIPKTSELIDRVINNVSNYALAYPLSGESIVPRKYGVQVQTEKGLFYTGKDQALGSNYFIPLGKCGTDSESGCGGEKKMVYIRDIPSGSVPLFGNTTMHSITGCDIPGLTKGRGLVPGMLEDLSDLIDVGGPNSVGDKCRRIRLPVGAHIYDPKMKCELDYDRINTKNSMEGKHQEIMRQVRNNCGNAGHENKTWWYEEHCSPSYNNCTTLNDIKGEQSRHESQCIPKAKPSFNVPNPARPREPQIKSIEAFDGSILETPATKNPTNANNKTTTDTKQKKTLSVQTHKLSDSTIQRVVGESLDVRNPFTRFQLQLFLYCALCALVCYVGWKVYG